MLFIDDFENLVTVRIRKDHSGGALEIKHREGIQGVEIGAQDGALLWIHGCALVEENTNAIAAGALGDLAYVIRQDHLSFCNGVIGFCHRCHGCALLNHRCFRTVAANRSRLALFRLAAGAHQNTCRDGRGQKR